MRRGLLLGVLLGFGLSTTVSAQHAVKFDSRRLLSCEEVSPPQQADDSKKVILVVITISAKFNADVKESTVESLRYELRFPKSVIVVDHLPKTQTGTPIAGAQPQLGDTHQPTDIYVKFGGVGRAGISIYAVDNKPVGAAERESRTIDEVKTTTQSDRLPPRGQGLMAGTANEGNTLYFDLMWSNQLTRAGLADYAFLAEVSKDWTYDVATLTCTARQSGAIIGRMTQVVGLYLSGNNIAKRRAEKMLVTARPVAVPDEKDLVTNSVGTRLKLIPAGSFLMGSTIDDTGVDKDETPQHRVTITKPFFLGMYEVTQNEYRQVMNDNRSQFRDSMRLPVESVSWLDAVTFCNRLSEREQRSPYYDIDGTTVTILGGNGYRLPTEAEWEYACRAPRSAETRTKHPFGDDEAELSKYAWFSGKSEGKTHPVGQKNPNRWDLYDMQGNVWEWCQDYYVVDYYDFSPETNPPGPPPAPGRVIRGGSWLNGARFCTPASRNGLAPHTRLGNVGFRLAANQR